MPVNETIDRLLDEMDTDGETVLKSLVNALMAEHVHEMRKANKRVDTLLLKVIEGITRELHRLGGFNESLGGKPQDDPEKCLAIKEYRDAMQLIHECTTAAEEENDMAKWVDEDEPRMRLVRDEE